MNRMLLAVAAFALTVAPSAFAQSAEGSLRGSVLDPSGALIPHAQVTLIATDGTTRQLTSDDNGAFEADHLSAGDYTLSISAAGFTPSLEPVSITSDKVMTEQVKLGISVMQEIDVIAKM